MNADKLARLKGKEPDRGPGGQDPKGLPARDPLEGALDKDGANRWTGVGVLAGRPERHGDLLVAGLNCQGLEVPLAFSGPRAGVLEQYARPNTWLSVVGRLVLRAAGGLGVMVDEWEFVGGVEEKR